MKLPDVGETFKEDHTVVLFQFRTASSLLFILSDGDPLLKQESGKTVPLRSVGFIQAVSPKCHTGLLSASTEPVLEQIYMGIQSFKHRVTELLTEVHWCSIAQKQS